MPTAQDPVASLPEADGRLHSLITPEACEAIRREIREVQGAEVFFLGRLNAEMAIEEVEALAYGNRHAVPAIMQYARPGDVVLHNHPSGHLEPSDADISISSELGGRGVGSYIIDNECTRVRVVVKPFRQPGLNALDPRVLAGWLRPGGRIADHIGGYEERPQQIEMLDAVAEAFNRDGIAVIEAGTGTGKSMAYLLPAIAWAVANGERIVVATHTINLQEQLLDKDIPLLMQSSGLKFEAALLKGRQNYLCRRKAHYLKTHPDFLDLPEKAQQLAQIQEWIRSTTDGSLSDLPFVPDGDVWDRVMSDADNCLRTRCPFYQQCFFYNARRSAAGAQVLVVNHHLLLADLALRAETGNYTQTAVLPPYHRLIIDEAHHLEEVATSYFGVRANRVAMHFALRRLVRPKTHDGLLSYLANRIQGNVYPMSPGRQTELLRMITGELPLQHQALLSGVDEVIDRIADAMEQEAGRQPLDQGEELKRRIRPEDLDSPFWANLVRPLVQELIATARPYLENLHALGRALRPFIDEGTPEQATPILELHASVRKIESVVERLLRFLGDAEGQCRWIEYRRRPGGRRPDVTFCIAPLAVADHLRESLLRRMRTVVLTSATLAVERRFDYFLRQVGADDARSLTLLGSVTPPAQPAEVEPPVAADSAPEDAGERTAARPVRTLLLDTPFDYERQVYLAVPTDLPDPTEEAFEQALADFIEPAMRASRGRAFVLFTAYSLLERVWRRVAPRLERLGFPCLRQGQTRRSLLTEHFRRDIGSVLFATASFWEGVDVPGEALSCLVLTRLPFRVPGEPLIEARIEELRRRRLDPFMHYIVPQAVIRFRQGFGRLIRTRSDRGAVLICDRRVMARGYGRMFLASLPTTSIHAAPAAEVLEGAALFFASEGI